MVSRFSASLKTIRIAQKWTGSAQSSVSQLNNLIDGRVVSGSGAIHDTTAAGQYEVAAAAASLNVNTPLGVMVNLQFLSKNLWTPAP